MFRYVAFRSCKDVKRSATGSLVTIVRASGPCHVKTFLDAALLDTLTPLLELETKDREVSTVPGS